MADVNHNALAQHVGMLVQDYRDGSWNPYSQPHQDFDGVWVERYRELSATIYGGEVPARVVVWTARVLCNNPTCEGHDNFDAEC